MGDVFDPYDMLNVMDRKNPYNNVKNEFEDGFGDEKFNIELCARNYKKNVLFYNELRLKN